jgi:hypothetical protein
MSKEIAQALAAPFDPKDLKQRPGRAGMTFTYADARAVAQRLDDALGVTGWQFEVAVADVPRSVVKGSLTLVIEGKTTIREDFGYPNSGADEEPLKSAASDALRRCAAQIGVGRSLYSPEQGQGGVKTPLVGGTPRSVAPTPLSDDSSGGDQAIVRAAMAFAQGDAAGAGNCPAHGTPFILRPGGVSKTTGKPYAEFYACPTKDAAGFCKARPAAPRPKPAPARQPEETLEELPF